MTYWDAIRGFGKVMTSPYNDKFPTLIVKGLDEFVVESMNSYWVWNKSHECTFF